MRCRSTVMRSKILLFLLLTLMLFATDGKIKVYIKSNEEIYTSQKITVAVELMTDAFSISDAKITFPASPGYMVQVPKSAAFIRQEEINGTDWQVVNYEYDVYALKAGTITISPVKALFSASMGYGQPKTEFDLQSEALHFDVKVPEGMKSDKFVLVTNNFMLSHILRPEKKQLIVGDAVELEVTQKAFGVPDILLQPVVYRSNAYLRVYGKEPLLKSGLSGTYDVSRTDHFTFVSNMEGNVTLPAQKILWWNSKTKKVQSEVIPEMQFEIISDPQIALDAKKAREKRLLLLVGFLLLTFLLFYRIASPYIRCYRDKRRRQYEKSEKGKYERLLKSIESGKIARIYQDFYVWIGTLHTETEIKSFKDVYSCYPEFKTNFIKFENSLVSHGSVDKATCLSTVKRLRKALLKVSKEDTCSLVKKLNP